MTDPFDTIHMGQLLNRWRDGDRDAADQLIRSVALQLESLVRRMLRHFPNVKRWADTNDVYQSAVLRLLQSLKQMEPKSTREFMNLAGVHIRRELIDLARHYRRRCPPNLLSNGNDVINTVQESTAIEDLDQWCQFHQIVEDLPVDEREVFSLIFYLEWKQQAIGELLHMNERTVRRRWSSACAKLRERLGQILPTVTPNNESE